MKKNLLLVIVAATLVTSSFAQSTELSKWSVGLEGGLSSLRGTQYGTCGFDRAYNPAVGIFAERTMNPFWGAGLEYLYQGNNANGTLYPSLEPVNFTSSISQITAFTSINLSNILAKYRSIKLQRFNTYFIYGIGAGFGTYTDNTYSAKANVSSLSSSFGVNETYNVSKSLELGIEGKYQWNSKANVSPTAAGFGLKDFYVFNINIRYKFGGVNNTRNISLADYEKMNTRREGTQEAIDRLQYELARQAEAIKKLEAMSKNDSIDGVAIKDIIIGQQYQMEQLTKQLTKTRKDLYKHLTETDPNYKTGDSTKYDISTFGFKTGSDKLTPSAFTVLDTIAGQLQKNTIWTVNIKGHTDNTGSEKINQNLSLKRAEAVKKYFVKKGIEVKRITAEGFASTKPIACNDTEEGKAKNRRVEIIVNK